MTSAPHFTQGAYIIETPRKQVTLVGTNHTFTSFKGNPALKARLTGIFNSSSHIMTEGCYPWPEGDVVQAYARSLCSIKRPHIESEAGIKYRSLFSSHGCKPELLGGWFYLTQFSGLEKIIPPSPKTMSAFNNKLIENMHLILSSPNYEGIDFRQSCFTGYNLIKLAAEGKPVWVASLKFLEWFQNIRNHYVFKPRTEELAALPGKKTFTIGADHVNFLADCLEERPLPVPLSLDDFLSTLDPDVASCLRI